MVLRCQMLDARCQNIGALIRHLYHFICYLAPILHRWGHKNKEDEDENGKAEFADSGG